MMRSLHICTELMGLTSAKWTEARAMCFRLAGIGLKVTWRTAYSARVETDL